MSEPDPKLEAALEREVAAVVSDERHPTRIAYDRARKAFPEGGDFARNAFHAFLKEEKARRDAATDRSGPRFTVESKDGVPMCGQVKCPKYARYQGRCTETDHDDPTVCIPAVRDMVIELDARKDAADPAFDEIVALCGLAKTWEYPGQVVRDVEDALKKKDAELAAVVEQNQKLQAALVYARDRRGPRFDFDEWIIQVEHALDNKIPPHALENAQAKEHQAWIAVSNMRAARDEMRVKLEDAEREHASHVANILHSTNHVINEQSEKLRVAEAVRDDARAASQRYLDEKRLAQDTATAALALLEAERRDRRETIQPTPEQCPWILPDGDPDEGFWYCKHPPGHADPHETEFGRGRNEAWIHTSPSTAGEMAALLAATRSTDSTRSCECSLKYRELAPGVHAKYCPLAGLPL